MTTWQRILPADAMTVCALMEAFHGDRLDERRRWETVDRCAGPDPLLEGWLLYEGIEPAGYAMLCRGYDPALARETMRLEELWVAPPFRRRRTGECFLAALPGLYPGCAYVEVPSAGSAPVLRMLGYRTEAPALRAACPERK
ncbi:MAG: hypothetical protein IKS31_11830 [Clostridia bacterium]|nr:hypothetical protein [Clostridia bacterium]MBR4459638.1 hypothetical protein [Clostridia bacterium]